MTSFEKMIDTFKAMREEWLRAGDDLPIQVFVQRPGEDVGVVALPGATEEELNLSVNLVRSLGNFDPTVLSLISDGFMTDAPDGVPLEDVKRVDMNEMIREGRRDEYGIVDVLTIHRVELIDQRDVLVTGIYLPYEVHGKTIKWLEPTRVNATDPNSGVKSSWLDAAEDALLSDSFLELGRTLYEQHYPGKFDDKPLSVRRHEADHGVAIFLKERHPDCQTIFLSDKVH